MSFNLKQTVARRFGENYQLHQRHMNRTLVRVLQTTGFDKVYVKAKGRIYMMPMIWIIWIF